MQRRSAIVHKIRGACGRQVSGGVAFKDEYSESDLEAALIQRLEDFLLELGEGFAFIGRQRRLRIDQTRYRVDLLLFHRKLRCLVIIDLKLGSLTHADVVTCRGKPRPN